MLKETVSHFFVIKDTVKVCNIHVWINSDDAENSKSWIANMVFKH
jgi:hypothetical protein